ncbi:YXWGXW repeat-containing protein [Burkholderia multivorans]|uniref:YXWGXW repeat-containing protein n=1 Tax=Burkholderia multivorans TaxID=87883 RepID=UPI001C248041|nr:YXWGXW repeat-containing protein [Burkholderia multivorans]MBU9676093.1 YXWGXW repeat-containing protein [Burkholderia multivorans]MEB2485818.1 YXWGXW repeat-containing protein [Burkholderia multivorans]MEB2568834.1 YXWGXW repeat-containing protein [Burkholderia multivorans]
MNRRSLLRAIGLTAAFVGSGGWLRAAWARPRPPDRPPHSNRPDRAPPPPRHDRRPRPPRPHGYIWTDGYWRWQHGRYIWVPGRWVARRPGRRWVPGYWRRQGHAWIYVDGYWR